MEFQTLSLVDYKPICFVYVLALANKKFYVGSTYDINERLERHMNNRGSEWTKLHKPIGLAELLIGGPEVEKDKTIELMAFHGYENVRGASWCQRDLKYPPKQIETINKRRTATYQSEVMPKHIELLNKLKSEGIHQYVFVLKLENDKYYIGSNSVRSGSYMKHFEGKGCPWTQKYKPVELVHVQYGDKYKEKLLTLEFMKRYGWQNVRGYTWSQLDLKQPPIALR